MNYCCCCCVACPQAEQVSGVATPCQWVHIWEEPQLSRVKLKPHGVSLCFHTNVRHSLAFLLFFVVLISSLVFFLVLFLLLLALTKLLCKANWASLSLHSAFIKFNILTIGDMSSENDDDRRRHGSMDFNEVAVSLTYVRCFRNHPRHSESISCPMANCIAI